MTDSTRGRGRRARPHYARARLGAAATAWCALASLACAAAHVPRRGLGDWILAAPDTALTPERWILERPHDSIDVRPSTDISSRICRVASHVDSVDGVAVQQFAEFDIPPAPSDPAYPDDTLRLADRRCMLRALWLTVPAHDSVMAARCTDSLKSLIAAHTHARADTLSGTLLDNYSRAIRIWRSPSGTFATTPIFRVHDDSAGHSSTAWSALAVHFAPNAGAPGERLGPGIESELTSEPAVDELTLRDALDLVDIPELAALRDELADRAANPAKYGADSVRYLPDSVSFPALRALLASAPELPPPRRAAALLSANLLVNDIASAFHPLSEVPMFRDTMRMKALEDLGARYDYDEPNAEFEFAQTWLEPAYHADSLSAAGRSAFLRLLSMGGGAASICANGPDQYRAVIAQAEERLRVAPADTAVLHWRLAQAYVDLYALASTPQRGEDTFGVTLPPASEAPDARRHALEHARIALVTLRNAEARADLWRLTFRILAGAPFATRFVCVND